MTDLSEVFMKTPVFRRLDENHKADLQHRALRRNLKKGDVISFYGDVWPYVILLHKGKININKESPEGRSLTVRTLETGDVFWSHALFDGKSTPGTLNVGENSTIFQWHGEDILPKISTNSEALWDLCNVLIKQLRDASQTIEELAFHPLLNRLARLLLDEYDFEANSSVSRTLTLDEMANRIGTTREMVCRLLYRLSDRNVIQVSRTQFVLVNKIEMEKLATGDVLLDEEAWS